MNIVYFSHSDLFSQQANAVHVINMCDALSGLGHKVQLYVWKNKKHKLINKKYDELLNSFSIKNHFQIINYPSLLPIGNSILSSFYLSTQLDFKNIDFIIARNLRPCFFSSRKNIPIFYETHKPFSLYNFFDKILLKKMVLKKNFYSLITISNFLIDDYNKFLFFKETNKLLLRDGSNINENITLKGYSKSTSIGYVGSLYEGRGIDIIIKLSNIFKNINFHIVGGNKNLINKYKLKFKNKNLIFHGYLTYKESLIKMNEFDILLAPYQANTMVPGGVNTSLWMSPIKLFEYMSSKKPIITSNISSLKEFMKNEYNCIMVNENDINEWSNAITLILNNNNLAKKIINNAFNDLKKYYTWEIRAKKLIERFTSIHKEY